MRQKLSDVEYQGEKDLPLEMTGFSLQYLSQFAKPNEKATCLNCGAENLYSFRWGLAHGDGFCSKCTWPSRLYHFLNVDGVEHRIICLLQYHPSIVKRKRRTSV